ncbi:MAG: choice-of-anchor A family protein [Verrucomicrobiaceae bacterium]|nr:MAG: choice-of-anchor A family protein [Verrucomicrobiaceae bacterium]
MNTSRIPPVLPLPLPAEARMAVVWATLALAGSACAFVTDNPVPPAGGREAASAPCVRIHIGDQCTDGSLVTGKGTVYEKSFDLDLTVENVARLSHSLSSLGGEVIRLDPNGLSHIEIDTTRNTVNGSELKVYTVDGSKPGSVSTISFGGGTGEETIVVNVLGRTVGWDLPASPADGGKVIWNFVDQPDGEKRYASVQAARINQMLKGTILAPAAGVDGNAGIGGVSIGSARNIGRNATGMDRSLLAKTVVVAAPEPAGFLTMGGFLGLTLFSRRRCPGRL